MSQQILSSKTKSVLLGFFLAKPHRYYSELEIRKQVSGRNLVEDLRFLTRHDFILKQDRKRVAFYALNKKAFLEPGLRAELAKNATRVEDLLEKQILKLRGLEFGVFTGIFHGRSQAQSDVLLVGKFTERAIESFDEISHKLLGQELAFAVLTLEEFEYRKDMFDRFIKDIFEHSHMVIAKKKPRWLN